jgi:hypothetical protein
MQVTSPVTNCNLPSYKLSVAYTYYRRGPRRGGTTEVAEQGSVCAGRTKEVRLLIVGSSQPIFRVRAISFVAARRVCVTGEDHFSMLAIFLYIFSVKGVGD